MLIVNNSADYIRQLVQSNALIYNKDQEHIDTIDFSINSSSNYVGILGGAGPDASAEHCQYLKKLGIPYIHYSLNSAPDKHHSVTYGSESFIPYYKEAIDLLFKLGISYLAIPCNTVHLKLDDILEDKYKSKFIDIRNAVYDKIKIDSKALLLGTDTVVLKLYDKFYNALKPATKEQKLIIDSIYLIKRGKYKEAKKIIIDISLNYNYEVCLLGCTELHLPFNQEELDSYNMISSSHCLGNYIKKQL